MRDSFELFNALEVISCKLASLRVLTDDIYRDAESFVLRNEEAKKKGIISPRAVNDHSVFIKAGLLIDVICDAEDLLKTVGIDPD